MSLREFGFFCSRRPVGDAGERADKFPANPTLRTARRLQKRQGLEKIGARGGQPPEEIRKRQGGIAL